MNCWKEEAMDLVRRPLAESGQNGRNEENGNSQMLESRGLRLQIEIELIHRVLIESGDFSRLHEFSARTLYTGSWKHDVLSLCKEAVKKQSDSKSKEVLYEPIYNAVKNIALKKISKEARQEIITEVKKCFLKARNGKANTQTGSAWSGNVNTQMVSIKKEEK